jgi:hypothetical protein
MSSSTRTNELSWDYFENTVKYKEIALPHTEDVLRDIT